MTSKKNKGNENKKTVLIFAPYYPPHIGGVEAYAAQLNQKLVTNNYKITVFTPNLPTSAKKSEYSSNSIEIIRFPAFEVISNYPLPKFWKFEFWKNFFSLFDKNFSSIISHTRFFNTSLLAFAYSKIKGSNWIHIEHGSTFVQTDNKLVEFAAKTYDLTFGKLILQGADHTIAISKAVKEFLVKLCPQINCTVIYRGFDLDAFEQVKPAQDLKTEFPNDKLVVYIGRLISGKGVSDLINAFALIEDRNIKLLIIGNGEEKNNLEKLVKNLGLTNNIIFLGAKDHIEVISILKVTDIFMNPSYSEGLPTTVAEAALCKTAIIATNVGGTNEIIQDNKSGFLIEPRNPDQIAEKIQILSQNNDLRERFAQEAYETASAKFNWINSLEKIESILK